MAKYKFNINTKFGVFIFLLAILDKELSDIDDHEGSETFPSQEIGHINLSALSEKIRFMEMKQKQSEPASLAQSSCSKTFKPGEDEKVSNHFHFHSHVM